MIALDTNVLVRLVTRDDEAQAQRAKAVFDKHAGEDGGLFVADIVLVELCWTLATSYELARTDIALTVRALLDNASIALESPVAVKSALASFEAGSADFPDCLIVAKAHEAGCSQTLTFDRRMKLLPGVALL
ncbi:MAG: type II toxin-antitoxin system VapC family toxin [Sulfuritalea sp.]|nr:type II toxin-antitoxin system VapC family toxin [Sulfuritalea sp.]MBK8119077.1 type II toxin-antitoxin system VapC family toxin [Sulfuritalea sp.]